MGFVESLLANRSRPAESHTRRKEGRTSPFFPSQFHIFSARMAGAMSRKRIYLCTPVARSLFFSSLLFSSLLFSSLLPFSLSFLQPTHHPPLTWPIPSLIPLIRTPLTQIDNVLAKGAYRVEAEQTLTYGKKAKRSNSLARPRSKKKVPKASFVDMMF